MLNNHHQILEETSLNNHVLATFENEYDKFLYVEELKANCAASNVAFISYDFKRNKFKYEPVDFDSVLESLSNAELFLPFCSLFLGQELVDSVFTNTNYQIRSVDELIACICQSSLGQASMEVLVDRIAIANRLLQTGSVSDNYWSPIIQLILMLDRIANSVHCKTEVVIEHTEVLELIFPKRWSYLEKVILEKVNLDLTIHKLVAHQNEIGYELFVDGIGKSRTEKIEVELKVRQCIDNWLVTTYIPYDTTPTIIDVILLGRFRRRYQKDCNTYAAQIAKFGHLGVEALNKIIHGYQSPAVATELSKLSERASKIAYTDICSA